MDDHRMIRFKDKWKGHGMETKFETQRILILKKEDNKLKFFFERYSRGVGE